MRHHPPPSATPTSTPYQLPELDHHVLGLVRAKAVRLCRGAGFTGADRDDLHQQLALKLFRSRQRFDPRRGAWLTFASVVIDRCGRNLHRDRLARLRIRGRVSSLQATVGTGDGPVMLEQLVNRREQEARLGRRRRSAHEQLELELDVAEIVAQLPAALRVVAERLRHDTPAQVGRDLGISRSSLGTLLRQIRRHFEKAGLRAYREPT